jgi:NAD(P)-dependent dehydrogenase (short-subunit alcohol dehydrogenase family)
MSAEAMNGNRTTGDLAGQVAVVIGGTRGIGHALSHGLARAGARVVVASRSAGSVTAVADELRAAGAETLGVPVDVSRLEDIERLVRETVARFGRIDVLVNNAAINPLWKRAERLTPEDWDSIMAVDLRGAFFACREVGRQMIEQRRGRIVNITSVTAMRGTARGLPYTAAKAGLIAVTQSLAAEWCPYGIRVNAVAPGFVATDLTRGLMANDGLYREIVAKVPMQRFAEPEEIVGLVVYLASEASSYVTGQVFVIDGGYAAIR